MSLLQLPGACAAVLGARLVSGSLAAATRSHPRTPAADLRARLVSGSLAAATRAHPRNPAAALRARLVSAWRAPENSCSISASEASQRLVCNRCSSVRTQPLQYRAQHLCAQFTNHRVILILARLSPRNKLSNISRDCLGWNAKRNFDKVGNR